MLASFLNLYIMPTSEQCDYDGLIVYEGNDTAAANRHGEILTFKVLNISK